MDEVPHPLDRKVLAQKFLRRPICEIRPAVMVENDDHRGDRIDHQLQVLPRSGEIRLATPQGILHLLPVLDVVGRRVPGDHLAVGIA